MSITDLLRGKTTRPSKTLDRKEFMMLMERLHLKTDEILGENLWNLVNSYNHEMVDRQFYFKNVQIRPDESLIENKYRMVVSGVMLEQGQRGKPVRYKFRYSELIPFA